MLKFATKKPPRLKHSEQAQESAHLENHGRILSSDEGITYLRQGDFTRFERINGDDMLDAANQNEVYDNDFSRHQLDNKENVGHVFGRGSGQPKVNWKAYNVKYGKVGVEKEIEYPVEIPERQVGLSRNGSQRTGHQYVGQGQRSQINPGYFDCTLENRRAFDINRNPMQDSLPIKNVTGNGYISPVCERSRPLGYEGHEFSSYRAYPAISSKPRLSHENPFPAAMEGGGTVYYHAPPSLDSTTSMSIDSMSTSGDRSSRTISDMDYDIVVDVPQVTKKGLSQKPPVPHKHSHVHMGRGTHGLCEGPYPARPGSGEGQMTSSLRKSPSGMKSGHHVRWGPGVVNSNQQGEGQVMLSDVSRSQGYLSPPTSKKSKKKTSLRSLLNLPKFPLSDDESSDQEKESSHREERPDRGPKVTQELSHRGTLRKFLDYRSKKKSSAEVSQPVATTELASLKYKKDYQMSDSSSDRLHNRMIDRGQGMKLNITQANQLCLLNMDTGSQVMDFGQDYDTVQEVGAVNYPIMHSERDWSIFGREPPGDSINRTEFPSRSPVNSVRPFLINGQANDPEDYDNFARSKSQQQECKSVSVTAENTTGLNELYQGRVTYDRSTPVANVLQTTSPFTTVTFDTYVTHGRPTESSVTFDTFVTLGRPYATSTPIPNGQYVRSAGQEYTTDGCRFVSGKQPFLGDSGISSMHGTSVTHSWNYNQPGAQLVRNLPKEGHLEQVALKEPEVHQFIKSRSHALMSRSQEENRAFAKLAMPAGAFFSTPQGEGPQVTQSLVLGKVPTASDIDMTILSSQGQVKQADTEQLKFKDTCTFTPKDIADYDDEVFLNLGVTPAPPPPPPPRREIVTPKLGQPLQTARRKLNFEGTSNGPVVTSCVPQLNHELSHEDTLSHNFSGYPKVQVVPGIAQQRGTMSSTVSSNLNDMLARDRIDGGEAGCILDLVYITERIISMSFASEEHENTYKYNLKEVTRMLKTKHGDSYLVINISEKKAELAKHCPQVLDYGWPENLAPPLERLCSICKAIDQWMSSDPNHVVVVHCKGGRGRIAVVIAAYMRYSNICASADQALDRFAMKRFYDDKLGGLPQPSQRRYVHYFAGLLSGAIQINSSALYLHHILIHGVPNFDTRGGCRPFIKVYQGMHPIFTSGVYNVTDNMQKVCISISPGIPLRGDILIKCYHKKNNAGQREIIWACQFHTCAISHNSLVFSKNELDYAINDPRFPDPGKVEFVFGNNSEGLVQVADFKSDVTVPVDDSTDALTRWDSYENFGRAGDSEKFDVNANGIQSSRYQQQQTQQHGVDSFRVTQLDHSQGPVDGSLYAQVNKQKLESQILQNGPTKLQNGGSYTSSIDSGISAFSVPMGTSTTHKSSSESWSYSTKEREFHQPNLSQSTMSKSYSASTSPRSGKVTLDEQTQLDQILSDLLSDQAFVSQKSPPGTRSFKTVEEHRSPEGNIVVQRGDVTYKIPEMRSEKHYTVKTESKTVSDENYKPVNAFSYTPTSPELSRSPKSPKAPYRTDYENNYRQESYRYQTNGPSSLSDGEQPLSWLQQQQAKLREKSLERDPSRQRNEQLLIEELKKSQTQNKYFQRKAQSEDESSKVSSSVTNGPVSPYSYTVSRTHTYSTDKSPSDTTFKPHDTLPIAASHTTYITEHTTATSSKVSNKPPPSPQLQRMVTPTVSSAPAPPPQRTSSRDFMQHQQQQQTRNRSYSGGGYQQASTSWRSETHAQPRVIQRHNSESAYDREHYEQQRESRQQFRTPPVSPRSVSPHTFQTYKTVYKTVHHDEPDFSQPQPVEVQIERQIQKEQQTVQDANKPHYITEVIVQRTGGTDSKSSTLSRGDRKESDSRLDALEKSLQAAQNSIMASTPWQQQQNVIKQEVRQFETRHYETKSEQRQEHRQEHHHEQQRVSSRELVNGGYPRSMSPVWDNYPVEHVQPTHAELPKKIEVTEEDRITLKPIGPGVQQLEPEGSHHSGSTLGRDSTLGRATTPSFPTSPAASAATPPFPVTPRTPYTNSTAGHVTSPTGTLQSDKMQYQTQYQQQQAYNTSTLPHSAPMPVSQPFQSSTLPHQQGFGQQQQQQTQQRQYQQYQTSSSQQYYTQQYSSSSGAHDGSLHVNTDQNMLMGPPARSPGSPGSPPSPGNLNTLRQQLNIAHNMSSSAVSPGPHSATGQSSPSVYFGLSRRGSLTSLADSEAMHTTPKFVKDTSKYWYKPNISREEAIMMLKDKAPGTFVVRDSNSFPGAFGLALKVATLPPNVQTKSTGDPQADLVRHFLIEPTSKGVRLRGCSNEPVFGSLASLVYQHSITPLALPCKLVLPEQDPSHIVEVSPTTEMPSSASQLLAQGAACNVVYLNSVDTESLTGPQAVSKACKMTFENPPQKTTQVHFKVSNQGITLTDNQRKLFFRRHYPVAAVTYCGVDPEDRKWRRETDLPGVQADARVFGFVARKQGSVSDNCCHLFAELDPDQPASAIVNFVTKVMIGQGKIKS